MVIIVFGMSPYFIASMAEIVDSTSQDEINHARTLKMGPWQTLWEVVIVGKRHHAIETMRQCAAIGWMMVAMTEGLIRNEGGIGVMLVEQNRYMLLGGILAIQFLILAVGLTQDYAIRFVRNATCGYTQTKKGGAK